MNQPFSKCQKEYEARLLSSPPIPVSIDNPPPGHSGMSTSGEKSEDLTPGTASVSDQADGFENNDAALAQTLAQEYHHDDSEPLASAFPPSWPHFQPSDGSGLFIVKEHPTAGKIYGRGNTFMDVFNTDQYSDVRKDNPYYPFASSTDWEVADFLLRSPLSMAQIDEFIKLKLVRCPIRLSLVTADWPKSLPDSRNISIL